MRSPLVIIRVTCVLLLLAGGTAFVTANRSNTQPAAAPDPPASEARSEFPPRVVDDAPAKPTIRPTATPRTLPETNRPAGQVDMTDNLYTPIDLQIRVGQTVTWRNVDSKAHDVRSRVEDWAPLVAGPGDAVHIPFFKAGRYEYFCTYHPEMAGTITVTD
jgi:plastocyanin